MKAHIKKRKCEDCGDDMPKGTRRQRCPVCAQLVCGYCYHHGHNLAERNPAVFGQRNQGAGVEP